MARKTVKMRCLCGGYYGPPLKKLDGQQRWYESSEELTLPIAQAFAYQQVHAMCTVDGTILKDPLEEEFEE